MWRRDLEAHVKENIHRLRHLETLAQDRGAWRSRVGLAAYAQEGPTKALIDLRFLSFGVKEWPHLRNVL